MCTPFHCLDFANKGFGKNPRKSGLTDTEVMSWTLFCQAAQTAICHIFAVYVPSRSIETGRATSLKKCGVPVLLLGVFLFVHWYLVF